MYCSSHRPIHTFSSSNQECGRDTVNDFHLENECVFCGIPITRMGAAGLSKAFHFEDEGAPKGTVVDKVRIWTIPAAWGGAHRVRFTTRAGCASVVLFRKAVRGIKFDVTCVCAAIPPTWFPGSAGTAPGSAAAGPIQKRRGCGI
jgi:hypothetical protein